MLGKLAMTLAAAALALPALAAEITSSVDVATLPKKKSTPLGLYLTPADAHRALTASPEIVFIDVRDPIEISFVGHPAGMDANIPIRFATHAFNPKSGKYKMRGNTDFIGQVDALISRIGADKDTPIFLICRSGVRSAAAAKILIAAGYRQVWNLVEGFEGDMDKKTGTRSANGWRNAGLPWAYRIKKDAAYDAGK